MRFFWDVLVTLCGDHRPPGLVPIFPGLTSGPGPRDRNRLAWQAAIVAFGVIVAFALSGRPILGYLGVQLPASQGAGGLLLLLAALVNRGCRPWRLAGRGLAGPVTRFGIQSMRKENAHVATRIDRVVSSGVLVVDAADGTASGDGAVSMPVENNTWIVGDDEEVIVIDPAHDAAAVLGAVGDREVLAVICTHGHFDHVAAALDVAERDEAPIALHPRDHLAWREVHPEDDPEIEMADGGVFEVADVRLEVLHTPGHSQGAVCIYCEDLDVVFSGDTLLKGRPGPYGDGYPDFPGQLTSIGENLLTLPPHTRVLPGHGEETTIEAEEKRFDSWVTAGPAALLAES